MRRSRPAAAGWGSGNAAGAGWVAPVLHAVVRVLPTNTKPSFPYACSPLDQILHPSGAAARSRAAAVRCGRGTRCWWCFNVGARWRARGSACRWLATSLLATTWWVGEAAEEAATAAAPAAAGSETLCRWLAISFAVATKGAL